MSTFVDDLWSEIAEPLSYQFMQHSGPNSALQSVTVKSSNAVQAPRNDGDHVVPSNTTICTPRIHSTPYRNRFNSSVRLEPECTNCAYGQTALAVCQNCSEYLCTECFYAHKRVRLTRNHSIRVLFKEQRNTSYSSTGSLGSPPGFSRTGQNNSDALAHFQFRDVLFNQIDFRPSSTTNITSSPVFPHTSFFMPPLSPSIPTHKTEEDSGCFLKLENNEDFLNNSTNSSSLLPLINGEQRTFNSPLTPLLPSNKLIAPGQPLIPTSEQQNHKWHVDSIGNGRPLVSSTTNVTANPSKMETTPMLMGHNRSYLDVMRQGIRFSFGGEGSEDGKLSRPWGICCDLKGRIIVADRSNNRIQIFTPDGEFIMKFGRFGHEPGQLNRPAGVTTNTLNQIVVADKDNHRIQVFTESGEMILHFGNNGRHAGLFNYPWGVACNRRNDIAVTDTRNHRVQIFNHRGQFIRKCGFDLTMIGKHLYSPRGLAFLPDGKLIVTDFNGHRIVILNASSSSSEVACFGSEGQRPGYFSRPQGITLDAKNNLLVCDSRSNRVQILSIETMRVVAILDNGVVTPETLEPGNNQNQTSLQAKRTSDSCFNESTASLDVQAVRCQELLSRSSTNAYPSVAVTIGGEVGAEMDRPCDICVGLDGRIYVVDFGNNCIRVY